MAESAKAGPWYVGVDVGGTNLRAGVVDAQGRIIGEARRPALAEQGLRAAVERVIEAIEEALENAGRTPQDILGIGLGVAGGHDVERGVCLFSPNFADSRNVPITGPIEETLGRPAFLLNDAFVTTLGEVTHGAGRGSRNVVMITLGTGIGGGAVIDGHLPTGHSQGFAEVGHMILEPEGPFCECGSRGCWETLAARNAIIRRAEGKIQQGRQTCIADRVKYRLGSITPALIAHCAEENDEVAREVLAETGYYVGLGITNLIQLYNPEILIVGGGIAQAGKSLWDPMLRTVQARAHMVPASSVRIVPAQLGEEAGLIGGAALAARELAKRGDPTATSIVSEP